MTDDTHAAPKIRRAKITDFQPNPNNPNKGSEIGFRMLHDSFQKIGAGRSGFIDKNGIFIAGNSSHEVAADLGIEDVIVIETTGNEWVVVQRNDLDLLDPNDDRARLAVHADNQTQRWNYTVDPLELLNDLNRGLDLKQFYAEGEIESLLQGLVETDGAIIPEEKYTARIESPIYEITGEKPAVSELYQMERTQQLLDEIDQANLPDDVKHFLRAAAYRHTVFHFSKIAEFYAHANADLQRLMENSALVIIDFERAVELGFTHLVNQYLALAEQEYDGDD